METEKLTTDQLLLMYRHLRGILPLIEAMLIERGAINPMRRYEHTATSFTSTVKVSG